MQKSMEFLPLYMKSKSLVSQFIASATYALVEPLHNCLVGVFQKIKELIKEVMHDVNRGAL